MLSDLSKESSEFSEEQFWDEFVKILETKVRISNLLHECELWIFYTTIFFFTITHKENLNFKRFEIYC